MLDIKAPLRSVRNKNPLVQCITNFVTANDCANMLLASGASPAMIHNINEAAEAAAVASALVCNMGTMGDDLPSMLSAGKAANMNNRPVVLDPVAVGVTSFRRESAAKLMSEVKFAVIRGNASEIRAIACGENAGSGVDVGVGDEVTEKNLPQAAEMIKELAKKTGAVIALSGVIDLVSDGERTAAIYNGCATMARVTGSGCMLSALTAAFCAAYPEDRFAAVCSVMAAMGVCGEIAEEMRLKKHTGNATFRTDMIDAMFNLTEEQLAGGARYELL